MSDERSEMLIDCFRIVFSAAEAELGAAGYFRFIDRVSAGMAAIKERENKCNATKKKRTKSAPRTTESPATRIRRGIASARG